MCPSLRQWPRAAELGAFGALDDMITISSIIVVVAILAFLYFAILAFLYLRHGSNKDNAGSKEKLSSSRDRTYRDDYDIWVDVLRPERPRVREFDLYGTRAALL